jgi:hypothetical protein
MFGAWPFHDKTHWYYVWVLTISWQNTLILCLGLDHFMTKHTDTISGAWPFDDKTHWYYLWGLTISWQNTLIVFNGLDHFMTNKLILSLLSWNGHAPDIESVCFVMKWSSPRHSISVFCHEMVKPQT